jgi:hypothetical protein
VKLRSIAGALVLVGYVAAAAAAPLTREDPVTALLRHQTDVGSWAGQKGDQATVQSFFDDAVLFSGGDGTVGRDEKLDSSDALSTLLKRQTQAFRDASQRGDMAAMRRYLDRNLLFVNEDGVVSGWLDFAGGSPAAAPKGIKSRVIVTDWVLHHLEDVAVASFVSDQLTYFDGWTLEEKYLSLETWVRRGANWKLMGSETIPLHQDPPAATLATGAADEYVGTYSAGPGSEKKISRAGNALAISSNGAQPVTFKAEAPDVFFLPGQAAGYARQRCVFLRDAAGQITGYMSSGVLNTRIPPDVAPATPAELTSPELGQLVLRDFLVHRSRNVAVATFFHDRATPWYGQTLNQSYRSMETWVKRGNAWKMIMSQGRQILPDARAVSLPTEVLDDYAGAYAVGSSQSVTISRNGAFLSASIDGAKPFALDAEARDVFFTPGSPRTRIIFQRDASGRVTGYLRRREERDLLFTRR